MMKIIKALLLSAVLGLSAAVLAAVDINLANQEELQQLKGIGAKKAADIIAYREANGRFESVDDLTKVKGIGKATQKNCVVKLRLVKAGEILPVRQPRARQRRRRQRQTRLRRRKKMLQVTLLQPKQK